jgi:hypothetical protein
MMHEIKSSFIEKFVEQDEIPFSRAMFVQALANTLKAFF